MAPDVERHVLTDDAGNVGSERPGQCVNAERLEEEAKPLPPGGRRKSRCSHELSGPEPLGELCEDRHDAVEPTTPVRVADEVESGRFRRGDPDRTARRVQHECRDLGNVSAGDELDVDCAARHGRAIALDHDLERLRPLVRRTERLRCAQQANVVGEVQVRHQLGHKLHRGKAPEASVLRRHHHVETPKRAGHEAAASKAPQRCADGRQRGAGRLGYLVGGEVVPSSSWEANHDLADRGNARFRIHSTKVTRGVRFVKRIRMAVGSPRGRRTMGRQP